MSYVLLVIGFALLIKGADWFVEGASSIAALLRISPMLIGLTIVAFGTSSPEATVSILAALKGNADVALGNIVGSNILNTTLAIGLTAFLIPMKVESATIRKEIPFTVLASVALLVLISDAALQGAEAGNSWITRGDGIILLLFFAIFLYYIIEAALNNREQPSEDYAAGAKGWGRNILFTLLGLAGIIIGGELVVRSSTQIALALGMSETLVGLTIVAIGTSLPEIVTSVTAALKKRGDIALGNIVGSNIFNLLFVLGTAATVAPLGVDPKIASDMLIMIGLMIVLFIFSRTRYTIARSEGIILAASYVVYLVYIIIRN
ncbi:sodium:calcium antiporter [Paenibacillus sambharensis]|uniref:Sodium:calcium antiporter n=1 Tax=Paenibacillus sambharensis TaxID=1803190 RepID=A0A2W1LSM9_9BACL|nr:calcium/sodium antiporter [Paenibacillus sambharensis]PZD94447.1 sodium:calcium antiporter [Paenibacillus sambharensis]